MALKILPKIIFLFGIGILYVASMSYAQENQGRALGGYPNRPVRILIGSTSGGGLDNVTRVVASAISDKLGKPMIIDNRPGASSIVAMDIAAGAIPDGYTLMSATNAIILHGVLKKVSYDILHVYTPLAKMTTQSYLFVVVPSLPVTSIKELIEYSKKNPHALHYATSGTGTIQHVSMERFNLLAGTSLNHVPYKGGGAAQLDLLGGRIQVMTPTLISVSTAIKSNKLRAIAVTGMKRMEELPELPTVAEAGLPGFESTNTYSLFAPSRTPNAIVALLNREVNRVIASPEIRATFAKNGVDSEAPATPEQLKEDFVREYKVWEKSLRELNLKLW